MVLLHPNPFDDGVPETSFQGCHLYTVQVLGSHRVVANVPTTWLTWMLAVVAFPFPQSAQQEFLFGVLTKPSLPLGLELAPSSFKFFSYLKFLLWWLILQFILWPEHCFETGTRIL